MYEQSAMAETEQDRTVLPTRRASLSAEAGETFRPICSLLAWLHICVHEGINLKPFSQVALGCVSCSCSLCANPQLIALKLGRIQKDLNDIIVLVLS